MERQQWGPKILLEHMQSLSNRSAVVRQYERNKVFFWNAANAHYIDSTQIAAICGVLVLEIGAEIRKQKASHMVHLTDCKAILLVDYVLLGASVLLRDYVL
jgi:hypothetical protein